MVAEDGYHPIQCMVRDATVNRKKNCTFNKIGAFRRGIMPPGHGLSWEEEAVASKPIV